MLITLTKIIYKLKKRKKTVELKIASALKDTDFERAKTLSEELEKLIKLM